MRRSALSLVVFALVGCAGEPAPEPDAGPDAPARPEQPAPDAVAADGPRSEPEAQTPSDPSARALAQEARRVGDPAAWPAALVQHPEPVVRARVARAMGRVRDARLAPVLAALPRDSVDAVEEERVFALGQIGDAAATDALTARLADEAAGVRARAVQALAKLGKPHLAQGIVLLLEDPDPAVRGQAALALARLRGRRVKPPAPFEPDVANRVRARLRRLLSDGDVEVVWRAAYALADLDLPRRLPTLELALQHADERVKVFALRGIGRVSGDDARRLETVAHALQQAARAGQVHAATTAAQVLASLGPNATPYLVWASSQLPEPDSKLGPRAHHLRAAALNGLRTLAAKGALDPEARAVSERTMRANLSDPSLSVRSAALRGLAVLEPKEAQEAVLEAARSERPLDRAAAATAAGSLEAAAEVLSELVGDADPRVACAALDALGKLEGQHATLRKLAQEAIQHSDLAVRTTGMSLLAEHGHAEDAAAIVAVLAQAPGDANAELRVEGVKALAALAKQDGGALAPHLRAATADDSAAVREAAAAAYRELTGEQLTLPPPAEERPPSPKLGPGDVFATSPNPRLALHTNKGKLVFELFREDAPHHVKSVLERARAKQHDGLLFHRVVSAFVVQGLDPRGDGWGTGDVFLRDEINQRPYVRGALGMPNAGPDTGGCQIFVTHVPTPHLDGRYTVFGQLVEGFDVLDAIEVGDRVERAEAVP